MNYAASTVRTPAAVAIRPLVNLKKHPLFLGPLFRGLRDDDLRALANKAAIKAFRKGEVVIVEGNFTSSLYVILSGRVKVSVGDEGGKELVLEIKGTGAYFGEMALDDGPRSASVVTLEPSQFAIISKTDFRNLLLAHPEIALRVIENLIHIVRGLNSNVRSFAMLDVYGRVSRLLLGLAVEQDGKLVIPEKLTQQDMASRVGSSREMVNRIFRGLATGGYIKIEGKKITLNRTLPAHW
jgi:CRP/FNR family cyclic AMP-dependent transcriptional regulator